VRRHESHAPRGACALDFKAHHKLTTQKTLAVCVHEASVDALARIQKLEGSQ
jgi:hypothetical protein